MIRAMKNVTKDTQKATYSGVIFDLKNPTRQDISWSDIYRGLTQATRFGGHGVFGMSVAGHSLITAFVASLFNMPSRVVALCLIHDAHEAYVGDIPTPLKNALPKKAQKAIKDIKSNIDACIYEAAGIEPPTQEEMRSIKVCDGLALLYEISELERLVELDYESLLSDSTRYIGRMEEQFSDFSLDDFNKAYKIEVDRRLPQLFRTESPMSYDDSPKDEDMNYVYRKLRNTLIV